MRKKAKATVKKAFVFLLSFLFCFFFLNLALFILNAEFLMGSLMARVMGFLLGGKVGASEFYGKEVPMVEVNSVKIVFSDLCTGLLELTVLISAIASSFGFTLRKRLLGILGAIPTIIVFNIFRIYITATFLISQNLSQAEALHSGFFRASLFFLIVGFYFLWFRWASHSKR